MVTRVDDPSELPEAFTVLLQFYGNTVYYFTSQQDLGTAQGLFQGASSQAEFENRMTALNMSVMAQDLNS